MLKPIKTFLTYLQRNANSSNIFGLTTAMGSTEQPRLEESIMIANEDLANDSGDPLYDPLALDDDCQNGVAVGGIDVHNVSINNEAQLLGENEDDDEDGVASGKIILVDVTTLKSSMDQSNELETDDEDADDQAVRVISDSDEVLDSSATEVLTISSSSEAMGTEDTSQLTSNRTIECVIESDGIQDSSVTTENDSFTSTLPVAPVSSFVVEEEKPPTDDPVRPHGDDLLDTVDAGGKMNSDCDLHQKQRDDGASESTVPKPVQGNTEEEEASDGSDSGLGLETSRSAASTSSSSSSTPLELPPIRSSLKRRSEHSATVPEVDDGVSKEKRSKKTITFEGVTVYYFPRIQGFGCIPSQGGCTLGMEFQHVHTRRLTLAEHSSEQRKVHRQQLQELNPRSSSSDDTSSEEEPSESGSEADSESYGFLQPVTTRQRRALLKAAGVRKIDSTEKDECREIRTSREVCGCTCRGFCDPTTCACSLAGIKCQVDRPSFPCGCTQEGCANKAGRVEFNPGRVRTHFIHTIMRLNLEGKANEMCRSLVANGGASVDASTESNITDGGATGENSYMAGSEKNWSNGPIRLQQQQQQPQQSHGMAYVPDMHAVAPPGPSGIGSALVSMNHNSLSSSYHQSLPLQTQHQHQYFVAPPDETYMSGSAYHNYTMASNAQMLLRASPPTSPHHLINGLISPATHSSDPVDVHYSYRDYFVGGTTSGVASDQLLPHSQMYYSYGGSSTADEMSGTTDPNYRHPHLPDTTALPAPIHQLSGAGSIPAYQHQQHAFPTGHDRHLARYNAEATTSSVLGDRDSTSTLDTPDGVMYASSETIFSPVRGISLNESGPTNSLGDASTDDAHLVDSGVEEIIIDENDTLAATEDNASPSPVITVDDDEDNGNDRCLEKSRPKKHPRLMPVASSTNVTDSMESNREQSSCLIDLSASMAGNAERLEAINDMLASSRRSTTLARSSIAAEDDDELRDFRHSPLPPPVIIDSDDNDIVDDVIIVDRTNLVTAVDESTAVVVIGSEITSLPQNGMEAYAKTGPQVLADGERIPRGTFVRPAIRSSLADSGDGSSELPSPSVGSRLVNKLGKTETGLNSSGNSSEPASLSGEPSENLCEIIKNSIAETAVSH